MSCTTCGNTCGQNCGCEKGLVTPPSGTPQTCPDPNPCSETFDAQCIIYTGDDILCNQDEVVATNTDVSQALNDIVDYFCSKAVPVNYTGATIECNDETVVPTNTSFNVSLNNIVNYFCNKLPDPNCECLYTAKATLDYNAITTPLNEASSFSGKAGVPFNINVPLGKAIEVVSASYNVTCGEVYSYLSVPTIQLITKTAKTEQASDDGVGPLDTASVCGRFHFVKVFNYPSNQPNIILNEDLWLIVSQVATVNPSSNRVLTANVLYRFVDYN